jgi:hypothetical protein
MLDAIPPCASGFPTRPTTRRYSPEWRADCLRYVDTQTALGKSLYVIAAELRLHDSTISGWFRAAGRTPPQAQVARRDWAETVTLAREMKRNGMTTRAAARALTVCEKRLSQAMAGDLPGPRAERARVRAAPPNRTCLRCARPFHSEGAHNRMCSGCRNYAGTLDTPYCPDPGGSAGRKVGARRT